MKPIILLLLSLCTVSASSLAELTNYALKHSPIIQAAKAQSTLSKLSREASKAAQYGELDLVGDYTHYNIERTLAPLPPSAMKSPTPITTTKDVFSVGLSYSVPLFTGGALSRQVEIDQIASVMSEGSLKLSKAQLTYNIRILYLSILSLQEILSAQRTHTHALKSLETQIAKEVSVGRKAPIEQYKSQADITASQTQEEILQSNIEITKASLGALVGKRVTSLKPLRFSVKKPHYSSKKLLNKVSGLTKLKLETLQLQKAQKMIQKAQAASKPQVNLSAYAGQNFGADIITDDWDSESIWQVSIKGKYNLLDFGKREINEEKARVALLQAQIHLNQVKLDVQKQLLQAIQKIKLSYAEFRGNTAQYTLSKKSAQIESVRYKNGASTLNDLLLAQSKVQFAKAKVIQSRYDYKKNQYYLDYILEKGIK
jgi:outer membrane protein TolC